MAAGGIEVARAYVTIIPSLEGSQKTISQELGAAVDKEGEKSGKSLGQKLLDGTGAVLKTGGKILGGLAITAATAAVTGVTAITKQALSSFKDYEQLSGGVEKLFGDTASTVMANASKAFATAGLDANQYMEQVTSVSASLIQSLSGDTEAAAKYADMAISDMADNANVFGSDIQSIQNAYSGFAKGNYGMLDNLKLGYQGTKDEMQRLLTDAEKLSGIHYELGNYADMVDAIHVIQTEMNITGTTAKEALGTIEGSMNMTKSAWSNFVTALAGGGDITQTLEGLKTALFGIEGEANGLINNVVPVVERVVNSIMDVLPDLISSLLPKVIETTKSILPKIIEIATSLIPVLSDAVDQLFDSGLDTLLNDIVGAIPKLIEAAANIITTLINALVKAIPTLLSALINNLPKIITGFVDAVKTIGYAIADAIPELLNDIIDAAMTIVDMLPQIVDSIFEEWPKFVYNFYNKLLSSLPTILNGIVKLVHGIVQALPQIIQSIVKVIPELIKSVLTAVTDNLDMIIEGLVNVVMALVEALPEIVLALVEAIPDIIIGIMSAVLDALPIIIESLINLVGQIIVNLPTILGSLALAVFDVLKLLFWDIPGMIVTELIPQIIETIGNVIVVIWNALKSAWNTITDWLSNIFKELGNWFFNTEVGQFMVNLATVGVMLYDEIKNFLHDLFEPFTSFMSELFGKLKDWFNEVFNKIKEVFTNIFSTVRDKLTEIFNKVKEVFQNIYNAIKTPLDNAKNTISTVINTMKSNITSVFNSIYSTVQNIFNNIKSAITGPIETAKNLVSNAISSMKNLFGSSWPRPSIQLPHINMSGSFSLNPPSVPHISLDWRWYAKGYDEAQILKEATIFGMSNGSLLAGGEHGNEVVVGEDHLIDLIRDNVGGTGNITVNVYGAPGQDEDTLARIVIDKIQDITNSKEVVYA